MVNGGWMFKMNGGIANALDGWIYGGIADAQHAWTDVQFEWRNCRYACKMSGWMDRWIDDDRIAHAQDGWMNIQE